MTIVNVMQRWIRSGLGQDYAMPHIPILTVASTILVAAFTRIDPLVEAWNPKQLLQHAIDKSHEAAKCGIPSEP